MNRVRIYVKPQTLSRRMAVGSPDALRATTLSEVHRVYGSPMPPLVDEVISQKRQDAARNALLDAVQPYRKEGTTNE